MGVFTDLSVRVTSYDHQPVQHARVTARRQEGVTASTATDERGRCRIKRDDGGELLIEVKARGFAGDQRVVTGDRPDHVELFILGQPGMPFYYRGTVRVPFNPITDAVGVSMRSSGEELENKNSVVARADRLAQRVGGRVICTHENFARSGVAVVAAVAEDPTLELESVVTRLAQSDDVERAGALVALSQDHASFLTNTVIARFVTGVDQAKVAAIVAPYGLTHVKLIAPLSNVHRLRFAGPATYAVLDASNALGEEAEVIYAEPDLIHTAEQDTVIPTDFLFPQQWDHQIIGTPDAWQALRDVDSKRTFGSPDVIVAVVDLDGVDPTHSEFAGTVSDGQTKVYEVFDFLDMVPSINHLANDHGTACASAATAIAHNALWLAKVSEGIAGVAGNCRLLAVRAPGGLAESRFAEMYMWIAGLNVDSSTPGFPAQITPGADVISSSYGSSGGVPISGLMSDTFDAITDGGRDGKGTLLFFSAGNASRDLDVTFLRPWSMYERCFCVAASTLDNDGLTEIRAKYSSFGSVVDFCAPSADGEGLHNPPATYGVTAAWRNAPGGNAIPGRPDHQSTLTVAAPAGATTLTLACPEGMVAGQALLIGPPGSAGTESRGITAVDVGTCEVTMDIALLNAHAVGTPIVAGPSSYLSGFGGTSYTTPVCAGTGALMLSINPQLQWQAVRDILGETAIKIDSGNTDPIGRWRDDGGRVSTDAGYAGPVFSEFFGHGRIDTSAAVRRAGERVGYHSYSRNSDWYIFCGASASAAAELAPVDPAALTDAQIDAIAGRVLQRRLASSRTPDRTGSA
jgi:subtilisin family serine protease